MAIAAGLLAQAPAASADPRGGPRAERHAPSGRQLPDPDRQLGAGWRSSTDLAMVAVPSASGLQIMVAKESDAYAWQAVATLAEPTIESDLWIGQACLTGDGRYAVAIFAPRQFANRDILFDQGGFAATVDLTTGQVTRLSQRVSISYFNPGCGRGSTAVLTTDSTMANGRTTLHVVDAATGRTRSISVAGQVTSAVPVQNDLVAAFGHDLVRIDGKGNLRSLAHLNATPHTLRVDRSDGIAALTTAGEVSTVWRVDSRKAEKVAEGDASQINLMPGAGGRVHVAGMPSGARVPEGWNRVKGGAKAVSSQGRLAIRRADAALSRDPEVHVTVDASIETSGEAVNFALDIAPGDSTRIDAKAAPALAAGSVGTQSLTGEDTPIDLNRVCSVPRNDPRQQAYQPSPAQVEWAADLAVRSQLSGSRPANYLGWSLPAYSPEGMFGPVNLTGGGRVPAQILLAILAQESNMWQASWHTLEGLSGNPLTADFYGTADSINFVDFSKADCGYGIGQVTTGMRVGDTYWTADQKKAISVDYQANIAASLRLLAAKWNETRAGGLIVNDGDPSRIVNWYFAVWAYNSGYYPKNPNDLSQPWGVGWLNNPINPKYQPNRPMFLKITYDDAKTPNLWSYPERIMGWAAYPMVKNGQRAYAAARYSGLPDLVQPELAAFCMLGSVASGWNQCDPSGATYPNDLNDPAGPCTRRDLKCWWHAPVNTIGTNSCTTLNLCGSEVLTYATGTPEPVATNPHPPVCSVAGLGAGQITIVDDVPNDVRPQIPGLGQCHDNWSNGGDFLLNFGGDYNANDQFKGFTSKVDFHQNGSGFGGHFWFAHSYQSSSAHNMRVTGTWRPSSLTLGWHRVLVHIPAHGAHTQQARYKIHRGNGDVKERVIEQRRMQDEWVNLGVFEFVAGSDTPRVELSNIDAVGDGTEDVAFDAMAFVRLPAKPKQFVVALGDSYASGEGTRVFEPYSDNNSGNIYRNACRRSTNAWARQVGLPGAPASNYQLETSRNPDMDFQFKACSGARTYNVVPLNVNTMTGLDQQGGSTAKYRWVTQLDAGFLDENTTLVTIAIGGNDAKWAKVIQACLLGCGNNGDVFPNYPQHWSMEDAAGGYMVDYVRQAIVTTLQEIRKKAINATIVLMGYPELFHGQQKAGCGTGLLDADEEMANRLAGALAANMQGAVYDAGGWKTYFADPRSVFQNHGICTQQEYVNGIIPGGQSPGDDSFPTSMNSFHPNDWGQAAYADVFFNKLYEIGYHW